MCDIRIEARQVSYIGGDYIILISCVVCFEVEKNACPNGTGRPAGMLQARIIWLVCPCAKAGVVH